MQSKSICKLRVLLSGDIKHQHILQQDGSSGSGSFNPAIIAWQDCLCEEIKCLTRYCSSNSSFLPHQKHFSAPSESAPSTPHTWQLWVLEPISRPYPNSMASVCSWLKHNMLISFIHCPNDLVFKFYSPNFSTVAASSRRSICVPTRRNGVFWQWWVISGTHFSFTFSNDDGETTLKHTRKTSVWG